MKIPLPCEFGKVSNCNGKLLPLQGVQWFQWQRGIEYTYFFVQNSIWYPTDFYTTFEKNQPFEIEIHDSMLIEKPIREHGFPLRGSGRATGIYFIKGKLYMDFIITSNYYEHIRVHCDSNGEYVPNGDVIFPKNWDTEKKARALLKSFKYKLK